MHHPLNLFVDLRASMTLRRVQNAGPAQVQAAVNILARDLPRDAVQRALVHAHYSTQEVQSLLNTAYPE
jgi:hypothetical protein